MATVTEELARILATARAYSQTRAAFLGTHDRDHALTLLREAANASGVEFYLFSPASRQRWNSSKFVYENCGQACADPNALLQSAGAIKMPALIAFEEFLPLLRTDGGDRAARVQLADMLSGSSRSEAHLLVFVEPPETETHIPNTVGGHVSRFSLPMPAPRDLTLVAREEILSTAHVRHQNLQPQVVEEWSRRFASALAGLTQSAARFSMQDTLLNKTPDFPAALSCLQDQKSRLLSQRLRMRILDASTADPPIGLDYVYEYLRYNRHRIGVPGRDRAKGILLVGPPGTGKSQFARSASRFLGMPELVEFRIAALMHSLLGATENRFAEALAVLDAMAPVCVFIDEIEKAFGDDSGSESTGGTMLRAVGSLLSWMSDSESATFTIATGNNLNRMGEIGKTMTRSGRLDRVFFVDVPTERGRRLILESLFNGKLEDGKAAAEDLARLTDRFSGADLQACFQGAAARAHVDDQPLTLSLLQKEVERVRPRVWGLYDVFLPLRQWAKTECEPAGPVD